MEKNIMAPRKQTQRRQAAQENYAPLIKAFKDKALTEDALLDKVKGWINKNHKNGVDKVRAGLKAAQWTDPKATLQTLNHADFLQALIDGTYLVDAYCLQPSVVGRADEGSPTCLLSKEDMARGKAIV
jgi:hypothetical protein